MKRAADYRPDIDGLRAIAVLSVLIFHYGATWMPGGFVGVDVFFVISGYLITKHLAEDISRNGHAIGPLLVRFYNKRIRRIVPALLTALVATLAAGWFLLMPGDYATTGESAAYSAFGLGNLYFYWNTGYFDREAELQPLLHMWSLGVEEQFYLVWPILLVGIIWIARGRQAVTAGIVAILMVGGFAYSVHTVAIDPKAAFYLPHPRAWELGAGALLAFLPAVRRRIPSEIMGLVGLALIGWSAFTLVGTEASPGWPMVPAIAGSALLIWPRAESLPASLLSVAPMRFVGLISYSLYLWHWPVLVLFRFYANGEMPTPIEAAALAAVSIGLAYASWRFVEVPARSVRTPPFAAIGTGIAAASVLVGIGATIVQNVGFTSRISPEIEKMSSLDVMWQWNCPRSLKLDELGSSYCDFGAPWQEAGTKAIVWGDSHAEHMAPIIEAAAKGSPASFLLYTSCPAALGGHVKRERSDEPQYVQNCADQMQRGVELLNSDPSINLVILSASWAYLPAIISGDESLAPMSGADLLKRGITDFIDATARPGRAFVLISSVPQNATDPVPCAIRDQLGLFRAGCSPDPQRTKDRTAEIVYPIDEIFKEIATSRPNVTAVLPSERQCAGDGCTMYLNGQFLYRDTGHLRRNLSEKTRLEYADMIGLTAVFDSMAKGVAVAN